MKWVFKNHLLNNNNSNNNKNILTLFQSTKNYRKKEKEREERGSERTNVTFVWFLIRVLEEDMIWNWVRL